MLGLIAHPYDMTFDAPSSSAWKADFPGSNLANNDYGRVGRTNTGAVSSWSAVFDLGSAKSVDTLGVFWHNLRAGDAIVYKAGDTAANATAGTLYGSNSLTPTTGTSGREVTPPGKNLLTLNSPVTARYWYVRLQVVGTVHPDGYAQASRVFIGKRTSFAIGPQKAEFGAIDLNQKIQLETGEERSSEDSLLIRPTASLDLSYAKETEMATVLGKYTLGLGTSKPMLVVPDLTAENLQDQIVFGRPEQIINLQSEFYDVWKFQAKVRSLGP